jgi:hypothetical protein
MAALLVAAAAGCGGPKKKVVPVEGRIVFADGQPLPPGTRLIFNPVEGGAAAATAVTAADGSFKVTHISGAGGTEPGRYTVLLAAPEGDPGNFFRIVPPAYYDGGSLHVEAKEGMAPLHLKVARARIKGR